MFKRLLILTMIFSVIFALPVNQENAEGVAMNLVMERSDNFEFEIRNVEQVVDDNILVYYIFHLNPIGFVIVAADDRVVPILGYSFDNIYRTDNQPDHVNYFMQNFKSSIRDIINNNGTQVESVRLKWEKYSSANINGLRTRSVMPLLQSRFDQGATWNTMCPLDPAGPDGRALVGCVAVSMAQVMHYWRYPQYGTGSNSYYHWDYGNISANFNTYYDYETMENNIGTPSSQKLLFHAGVAVEMGYGPDGSGAWVMGGNPSTYHSMRNYFLFRNDMESIDPSNYSTTVYRALLKEELDNNRPIIYRGCSTDGCHAWNVDGYQDDEFHQNWGWGGYNNGFFPLSTLGGFSYDQGALIKIQPQSLDAPNVVLNSFSSTEVTGDGDGVINPGELVDLIVEIENMVPWLDADGIDLILESESDDITVLNDFIQLSYLASGSSQVLNNNPFNIEVSPSASLGSHTLTLSVVAESSGNEVFTGSYEVNINVSLNQSGFPFVNSQTIESSPLSIDINGDGEKELFFGDYGGFVHGIDRNGVYLDGFPIELDGESSKQIWGSIAADDVDGDGEVELIVSSKNKHVYCIGLNGNIEMDFNADQYLMGTPALGDVDGDGLNEIIVSGYSSSGDVFVINHDGTLVDGFPAAIDEKVLRGAAVADLNDNGKDDIVVVTESDDLILVVFDDGSFDILFDGDEKFKSSPVIAKVNGENVIFAGSDDGHLYGVNISGQVIIDFITEDKIRTSPTFMSDGGLSVIIGSYDNKLYVIDSNGSLKDGWPIDTGSSLIIDPIVTDIDGDNIFEIVTGNANGLILAYHLDGTIPDGFPIQSGFGFSGSMLSTDVDSDGDIEIFVGTNTFLTGIDFKNSSIESESWSMHRGNIKRNGLYTPLSSSGDLNQDGINNVLDIVMLVNAILAVEYNLSGDMNNDGILNVLDVVQLVNLILE